MAEQVSENFVRADYRLPYCRPILGFYLINGVAEITNCVTGHKMAPHCYLINGVAEGTNCVTGHKMALHCYLSNGVEEGTNCFTGHKMAPHCYLSNGVAESTNCVTGDKMAPHCYLCLYDCDTHSASYARRLHVKWLLVFRFELRLEWLDKSQ
jgi:hypothetical protein